MLNYSKLQNGSDIRGVALEGKEEVNLGKEETLRLTASWLPAATWLLRSRLRRFQIFRR